MLSLTALLEKPLLPIELPEEVAQDIRKCRKLRIEVLHTYRSLRAIEGHLAFIGTLAHIESRTTGTVGTGAVSPAYTRQEFCKEVSNDRSNSKVHDYNKHTLQVLHLAKQETLTTGMRERARVVLQKRLRMGVEDRDRAFTGLLTVLLDSESEPVSPLSLVTDKPGCSALQEVHNNTQTLDDLEAQAVWSEIALMVESIVALFRDRSGVDELAAAALLTYGLWRKVTSLYHSLALLQPCRTPVVPPIFPLAASRNVIKDWQANSSYPDRNKYGPGNFYERR
ncbi:hypothetical protein C1H76_3044 [Elsinoe australis]|uniref:Uncharacterized protein n=1 Tax=Elsinoe australis TaxID=40998 RepID=A0A4U7B030_9PEZI|nr:hypothetical protein C1H76_3044 [Elsinoe australis]